MTIFFFWMIQYKLIFAWQSQEISINCLFPRLTPLIKLAPIKCWSEKLSINKDSWSSIFKSLRNVCKETRLKEFKFKLIHGIVITRKELFKFGFKTDDECLCCGNKDSIEHTFIDCPFTGSFTKKLYNGSMKLIVVRSPRPRRNSCSVLFRAPKKQS